MLANMLSNFKLVMLSNTISIILGGSPSRTTAGVGVAMHSLDE